MGKGTDKLFITHSEWAAGDHASSSGKRSEPIPRAVVALPFWTCSISQQPVAPNCAVCDAAGHVFDITNVLPYILRSKINPVTNEPLASPALLTKLKLATNGDGDYIDPVTYKVFQPQSDAVVIKPSGNVYLMSTITELCLKPKKLTDLLTDVPFVAADIVHLVGGVGVLKKSAEAAQRDSQEAANRAAVKRKRDEARSEEKESPVATEGLPQSTIKGLTTTHHLAASVTSTATEISTASRAQPLSLDRLLVPKRFEESGFAAIETSLGTLTVELFPKYSPKAVYNFVGHAKSGYYRGSLVHRNVKHFMAQAGDPTGTGRGGTSVFGKPFSDETNSPYRLDARGVLAMANRGKNTNGSQFFITYRRAPHLDGKHTVFGKVVSGFDVLDAMERQEVDAQDRPTTPIVIKEVRVLEDPFEQKVEKEEQEKVEEEDDTPWLKKNKVGPVSVGKYLQEKPNTPKPADKSAGLALPAAVNDQDSQWKRRRKQKTTLEKSSFAGW